VAVDAWEDYLARLWEAGHGAWLGSTDDDAIDLFSYYGLGIMLNSAQSDSCRDLLTYGPGVGHVWRFANRVGKTTGLDVVHGFAAFRKWRPGWEPVAADWQTWKGVPYKTLHSAPENRLMGKAWDQSNDPMAFHRDWLLEAFRVLQPGGIIKVFSGTRTKH
jgi:hypothetical protein